MHITREIEHTLLTHFQTQRPKGLILAGMVGCGKTTLVENSLKQLKKDRVILRYSGDDIKFRAAAAQDSRIIHNDILSHLTSLGSHGTDKCLIFVDEVQKSESIFDALKYAFDHIKASFIVSGSNPSFLSTIARQRLQRRADLRTMLPLSLPEILAHTGLVSEAQHQFFRFLLFESKKLEIPNSHLQLTEDIKNISDRYLKIGGLPLAYLSGDEQALFEIRQTVERGFESLLVDGEDIQNVILVELAKLHSKEFTYTNIFQKTGLRRRDQINTVIDHLKNHGYLVTKKPTFLEEARRSYLCIHSWTDPGILTYLLGGYDREYQLGQRIEGVVHSRLSFLMQERPYKNELGYFKPYRAESGNNIKFLPGEVDFIYSEGKRNIPIEVKASVLSSSIDTKLLERVVEEAKAPFGIILYGGVPILEKKKKLIFWPWWLV